ncbi:MAG: DJ-1/PfpI family protein [Bacilli bacterium]|nr:DJ-1/PfpI family protein [Bacilli bacterium]
MFITKTKSCSLTKVCCIKNSVVIDAIILPGGLPGAINIKNNNNIIKYLQKMNNEGKLIAAICAAPLVLKHADVLLNKKATIYPDDEFINLLGVNYLNEPLIVDKNIITAAGPAVTFNFAFAILEYFNIDYTDIKKGMLFE